MPLPTSTLAFACTVLEGPASKITVSVSVKLASLTVAEGSLTNSKAVPPLLTLTNCPPVPNAPGVSVKSLKAVVAFSRA